MASIWDRLRGGSRGRHEQLASHDEDNELEAAFAGPAAQTAADTSVTDEARTSSLDQPYDTTPPSPVAEEEQGESHPLQSGSRAQHRRSGSESSSGSAESAAPPYDFELNPSELRAPPSSAVEHPSNSLPLASRAASASRTSQIRHALSLGISSLARYGRLSTSDPDTRFARYSRGTNDGVFANLSAKPEARARTADGQIDWVGGDDEASSKEVPPVGLMFCSVPSIHPNLNNTFFSGQSYDAAALDTTPPYWETTIIAPTGFMGPDEVLVEGLPIGNIFAFAWNLLVSMSFQFVGFLLTYVSFNTHSMPPHTQLDIMNSHDSIQLLHTSHAAKHGSRAGLGITLIQYALYLRGRAQTLQNELDKGQIPPELVGAFPLQNSSDPNAPLRIHLPAQGAGGHGLFGAPALDEAAATVSGSLTPSATVQAAPSMLSGLPELQREGLEQAMEMSSLANDWLSYMLMFIGWALLVGAFLSYWKAWRWAKRIRGESAPPASTDAPVIPDEVLFTRESEVDNNLRRAGLM